VLIMRDLEFEYGSFDFTLLSTYDASQNMPFTRHNNLDDDVIEVDRVCFFDRPVHSFVWCDVR